MPAPYRSHDNILARYTLRTYPVYLMAMGVSFLAVFIMGLRLAPYWDQAWPYVVVALSALLPMVIMYFLPQYRIAGGSGELRIYKDFIEVPHASRPEAVRFAINAVEAHIAHNTVMLNGVMVSRGASLLLIGPSETRKLSSEVFETPEAMEQAVRNIRRLQEGLEIEEDDSHTPGLGGRDAYDDKLDDELSKLE